MGQQLCELAQACFLATCDIEHFVCDVRLCREQVGARNIVHMYKIHGLGAIAEDDRRQSACDTLHPTDEDLGVGPVYVHSRTVDIEVPQCDVALAVHLGKTTQQTFVE